MPFRRFYKILYSRVRVRRATVTACMASSRRSMRCSRRLTPPPRRFASFARCPCAFCGAAPPYVPVSRRFTTVYIDPFWSSPGHFRSFVPPWRRSHYPLHLFLVNKCFKGFGKVVEQTAKNLLSSFSSPFRICYQILGLIMPNSFVRQVKKTHFEV